VNLSGANDGVRVLKEIQDEVVTPAQGPMLQGDPESRDKHGVSVMPKIEQAPLSL